jgi:minichromosome maintenance protein 10
MLEGLLKSDKEGMKAVLRAREVGLGRKGNPGKRPENNEAHSTSDATERLPEGKNAYSAQMVKRLGFDPLQAKVGPKRSANADIKAKVRFHSSKGCHQTYGDAAGRTLSVSTPKRWY